MKQVKQDVVAPSKPVASKKEPPSFPVVQPAPEKYINLFFFLQNLPSIMARGFVYYIIGCFGLPLLGMAASIVLFLGSLAFWVAGWPCLFAAAWYQGPQKLVKHFVGHFYGVEVILATICYVVGLVSLPILVPTCCFLMFLLVVSFWIAGWALAFGLAWLDSWSYPYPQSVEFITDLYCKLVYFGFQFEIFFHKIPSINPQTLRVDLLRDPKPLKKYICDFTGAYVPYSMENEQENTTSWIGKIINDTMNGQGPLGLIGHIGKNYIYVLPFSDHFDEFQPGEDPVQFSMRQVGNMYPPIYQEWPDKQSDVALTRFCKDGLAAHRVEVTTEKGVKYYVVRTNALAALPVRDGFANYGGDVFFDMEWRPIKIVDAGLNSSGPVTTRPGDAGWAEAKFRFRSSMSVLVTAGDHLYGIHLIVANYMTTAVREYLPTTHPIRRFLMPFTFNTIVVNDNAATNLCRRKTLAYRCFALTESGLEQAYKASSVMLRFGADRPQEAGGPCLDYEAYVDWLQSQGIDTEYYRQGRKYWLIVKKFCQGILDFYYNTPQDYAKDQELMQWACSYLSHIRNLCADYDLESYKSDHARVKETITNILAHFVMTVTAHHEQAGAVEVYVQDVSFCAFKWTPGSLMGTKQTATAQAALMMMTATPFPKIWPADWTYVFPETDGSTQKAAPKQVFDQFQQDLGDLHAEVQKYNKSCHTRSFPNNNPLYVFDPTNLETSISV
eukprot:TRINITY_DN41818_c0_g1_i1.p1 TRINITY_DN41818_c0_g1~~TRINITY_DN41818_c0_g1_i1.p1  ORF type:complete len:724 (-),score=127.54 TRINITY_DN41818_c0_g1_i1:24-2195(-)